MCGRYSLALSNEEVYDSLENQLPRLFRRQGGGGGRHGQDEGNDSGGASGSGRGSGNSGARARWERPQDYRSNYNIAPKQRAPVIRRSHETNEAMIETMQWGLVPHWTKHPPTGPLNTINARSEGLIDPTSGGMWHALKAHKRCVIPAQGYYEWQKKASSKIAHFTRSPLSHSSSCPLDYISQEPATVQHPPLIFFAGLYDIVKYVSPVESRFRPTDDPDSDPKNRESYPTGNPLPLATYTILTTQPPKDFLWLHDRMPCILRTEDEIERWLEMGQWAETGWEEGKGGTGELLRGCPGLDCYPVPPEVGKIGNRSHTFIEPVSERSDGIKSFFQKQSPAKPKTEPHESVKKETSDPTRLQKTKFESQDEDKPVRQEADGIATKIEEGDDEKGLGDDSNAPNPDSSEVKAETSPFGTKRKAQIFVEDESEDEKALPKRGGHQTKVIRRPEKPKSEQKDITSFFKSPDTATKSSKDSVAKKSKR